MTRGRIETKLEDELKLHLPPAQRRLTTPNRTGAVQVGNLLFVSGHGSASLEGYRVNGKVGADMTVEEARHSAQGCALNMLATIRECLGDLDRVRRVVKLLGMVNGAPGFKQQAAVVDGASDLFYELWGPAGCHARSAVGMFELPNGMAVEIEGVFEVEP